MKASLVQQGNRHLTLSPVMFLVQLVMRYRGFIGERRRRFFPTSLRDTPDHLRKVTSAFITEFLINFHFKFVHCVAICLRIQLFSSIDSQYILLLANVVRKATIALAKFASFRIEFGKPQWSDRGSIIMELICRS